MMKLFEGINNIEFAGFEFVKDLGKDLPVFTLTDLPVDEWNARAQKNNTAAFIQEFSRMPLNYDEVLTWVYSLSGAEKERSHSAENTVTSIA